MISKYKKYIRKYITNKKLLFLILDTNFLIKKYFFQNSKELKISLLKYNFYGQVMNRQTFN